MTELKNDNYLRALLRQPVDYTPVWMMRQAGRYLPEYREVRKGAGDFMSVCRNVELACEVTIQPLRRFKLDAAILFSDILTIPDAMGLGLYFETGEGPKFERPITCKADIDKIGILDPEDELGYVMNAVRTIRKELNGSVPLIGFSGSPWTLATYMIEGGSSKAFTKIKKMMFSEPQTLHLLLDKLADSVISYLNAQIAAGAQSVMVFDTWGGVLSPRDYKDFSLQYMTKIVDGVTFNLEVADQKVMAGVSNSIPLLKAYSETPVKLNASIGLFNLLKLLAYFGQNPTQEIKYNLKTVIDPSGFIPLTVNREGILSEELLSGLKKEKI